eukprot:m.122310 g.122310  ORF g.122310 m.122310 type:complete len:175 (+) comp9625_c0_seq7:2875-3399(+)
MHSRLWFVGRRLASASAACSVLQLTVGLQVGDCLQSVLKIGQYLRAPSTNEFDDKLSRIEVEGGEILCSQGVIEHLIKAAGLDTARSALARYSDANIVLSSGECSLAHGIASLVRSLLVLASPQLLQRLTGHTPSASFPARNSAIMPPPGPPHALVLSAVPGETAQVCIIKVEH